MKMEQQIEIKEQGGKLSKSGHCGRASAASSSPHKMLESVTPTRTYWLKMGASVEDVNEIEWLPEGGEPFCFAERIYCDMPI
jgi:hypothetical protein